MTGVTPLIEDLLADLVAADPVTATYLGLTDGMDRLPSYSSAAVSARVRAARHRLTVLEKHAAAADVGEAVDAFAGIQVLRRVVRQFDQLAEHRRRPSLALDAIDGLLPLMMREIAPLEDRLAALEGRLSAVPGLLEEARGTLATGGPRVMVENAIDYADAMLELVDGTVRAFARDGGREGALDRPSELAAGALRDYRTYLNDALMPAAGDECAAGRAALEEILRYEHVLDESPEAIAGYGRAMMKETRALMEELAGEMGHESVAAAVDEAQRDHVTAEGLVAEYRAALEEARAFVVSHDIVTLAPGEELEVMATPAFLRRILPFAAYESPGLFEKRQVGFYFVTPPREGMSAEKLDEALRSHPRCELPTVGVHEAYPGHHVQLTRANRAPTLGRRIASLPSGGTLLVEGWAFYCEELMEREGFLSAPHVRLMRLNAQLWRACRVVIDVELHLGRMTFPEAVELLEREAHMGRYEAELECRRYVEEPGQPMSYLIGKREVMALAADYAKRHHAPTKQFHDDLLEWGCLPPSVIRWGLGLGGPPPAIAALRE